ncbi:hypothetical protein CBR_g49502 [Chara braunii]|uniref:Core Histone H2A/H2B/H3 domain-containing protein n=1 Tax=Chara braunii TaxID=69332 RepID=A0A388K506_CHABU|nr:hypothetical protein CBR_g49502 [Chara braunii]|eukprot:GBG65140.1 hypothetical protein CBR_g49502 [Chara braunii]
MYSHGLLHHIQYMPVEDMAGRDDNRGISEPRIAHTIQPACEVNGPPADTDVACAANRPAEDTDAGCAVVDKSGPPSGTIDSDGSRKIGRGIKRKATSRRDNGGTPTLAQKERGGNGKGGRTPMARGQGRGRGRGQGRATMDGPGEARGKIGGSKGVQRRNRRPGEAAVAEMQRLQRSTDLCIAYRPFVRLVKEIVQKEEIATDPMRFQMLAVRALLEAAEAYLVHLMESSNEVAIHSKRTDSEKDKKMTAMTAEQVERAEREVMKYVTEGIHYDNEDGLRLLRERAPAYFNVTLDIQRSIAANKEKSTRAQQLLHRLQQSAYVAKDETLACCSAYTLQRVVEWMCDDEDNDKSKREGGGFYDRSTFKKFVTSWAKEAQMLKTEAHDILKSNAAEILALSRMNKLPQTET